MRKIADKFYLLCGSMAALSMVMSVLIILSQIIARFFNTNIPSSDDISGYTVAWATFFGLSYAMDKGSHIRVDLFVNLLKGSLKNLVQVAVGLLSLVLISTYFGYVFLLVKESFDYGDVTQGHLPMPLWIVQSPYVIGVFAFLISIFDQLCRSIHRAWLSMGNDTNLKAG
ncbi:MAG: TRAP transporter small permease [SAR324 cluster bacterium]|nr:TRAP transporter small permease [SAR324 cluster bacterium]